MNSRATALGERVQAYVPHPAREAFRTLVQARVSRRARRLYCTFIKPGDLVFDIGAHTGVRTGVFLELGARVVAVEPQAACVKALRTHYGGDPAVAIVPFAVAESARDAELFVCSNATTVTTMSRDWMKGRFADQTWDRVEPIRTTTLDSLIGEHGAPTFCKVDVEGFELDVLRGLSEPLPALSIEFVGEALDATDHCLDRLEEIGFTRFNFSLGESMRLRSPEPMSRRALSASLQGFADTAAWGDVYAMA
jgi:FkbM family methyltransferase